MNIGILGSGSVGKTLGKALVGLGHRVSIGTRNPAALDGWKQEVGESALVDSGERAAAWADLIVLATVGRAAEEVVLTAGVSNFEGKIVIDTTDPLDFSSGKPGLFVGTTDSLGERIQRLLPGARVVKALNTVAAAVMVDPSLTRGEPDLWMAGNDAGAKGQVEELLSGFGWKSVVDLGGIENARWLEALSLLWVVYNHNTNNWLHAFRLIGK